MINIFWKEFVEKYKPIKNTFEKEALCDGHMFTDKDQLKDVPKTRLWTIMDMDEKGDYYITNGFKYINALGYLVSKEEYAEEETIEIRLEDNSYEIKQ